MGISISIVYTWYMPGIYRSRTYTWNLHGIYRLYTSSGFQMTLGVPHTLHHFPQAKVILMFVHIVLWKLSLEQYIPLCTKYVRVHTHTHNTHNSFPIKHYHPCNLHESLSDACLTICWQNPASQKSPWLSGHPHLNCHSHIPVLTSLA